jgi:hypothetical protein
VRRRGFEIMRACLDFIVLQPAGSGELLLRVGGGIKAITIRIWRLLCKIVGEVRGGLIIGAVHGTCGDQVIQRPDLLCSRQPWRLPSLQHGRNILVSHNTIHLWAIAKLSLNRSEWHSLLLQCAHSRVHLRTPCCTSTACPASGEEGEGASQDSHSRNRLDTGNHHRRERVL